MENSNRQSWQPSKLTTLNTYLLSCLDWLKDIILLHWLFIVDLHQGPFMNLKTKRGGQTPRRRHSREDKPLQRRALKTTTKKLAKQPTAKKTAKKTAKQKARPCQHFIMMMMTTKLTLNLRQRCRQSWQLKDCQTENGMADDRLTHRHWHLKWN